MPALVSLAMMNTLARSARRQMEPIGKVVSAKGAWVTRDSFRTRLRAGSWLYPNDYLETDDDGSLRFRGNDGRECSLGPETEIGLEEMMTGDATGMAEKAIKGLARMLSNEMTDEKLLARQRNAMQGTCGIRG